MVLFSLGHIHTFLYTQSGVTTFPWRYLHSEWWVTDNPQTTPHFCTRIVLKSRIRSIFQLFYLKWNWEKKDVLKVVLKFDPLLFHVCCTESLYVFMNHRYQLVAASPLVSAASILQRPCNYWIKHALLKVSAVWWFWESKLNGRQWTRWLEHRAASEGHFLHYDCVSGNGSKRRQYFIVFVFIRSSFLLFCLWSWSGSQTSVLRMLK